jgi:hypothetical protein
LLRAYGDKEEDREEIGLQETKVETGARLLFVSCVWSWKGVVDSHFDGSTWAFGSVFVGCHNVGRHRGIDFLKRRV